MDRTVLFFIISFTSWSASAGVLEFTETQITVAENSSTFDLSISRTGNVSLAASVTVKSIAGTASAGVDYVNMSQIVNWTAGDNSTRSVSVSILDDALVEGTESFSFELTGLTGDTAGTDDTSQILITDFEEGAFSFVFPTYSGDEDDGVISINVIRQMGSDGDATVVFKTEDDSAEEDSDYEGLDFSIEFLDGESIKIVDVPLVDDSVAELLESFAATLSSATGGATLGSNISATISIRDSDLDFTPALQSLDTTSDEITIPPTIDLSQNSFLDSGSSLLDTVNTIDVLESTGLVATQNASGIVEVIVGDETIYLNPFSVTRSESGTIPSILIRDDQSGSFHTAEGISINFQPALQGLSVLQTELALLSMPEIQVSNEGNIVLQIDQGPPILERDENGIVTINNSYWDRFNLRPSALSFLTSESTEGIKVIQHSSLPDEVSMLVFFSDGQSMRQQLLSAAPLNQLELFEYFTDQSEFSNPSSLGEGLIQVNYDDVQIEVFTDYVIRRSVDFDESKTGVFIVDDLNGDGENDFNVVFSTGDEQYLFSVN